MGNKRDKQCSCPSLLLWETFQAAEQYRGAEVQLGKHPQVKRTNLRTYTLRRPTQLRFIGQLTREEKTAEGEPHRYAGSPSSIQLVMMREHACEKSHLTGERKQWTFPPAKLEKSLNSCLINICKIGYRTQERVRKTHIIMRLINQNQPKTDRDVEISRRGHQTSYYRVYILHVQKLKYIIEDILKSPKLKF